jgi:hypothetical protein
MATLNLGCLMRSVGRHIMETEEKFVESTSVRRREWRQRQFKSTNNCALAIVSMPKIDSHGAVGTASITHVESTNNATRVAKLSAKPE